MPNRLASATSPYLLQHKDNPVEWYEWGADAFSAAKDRDLPVLLSVGYSSCHWCHVMAHESFEDEHTAEYMNTHFVNVKVDREERPDVDRIYMDAVTAMTGRGGWPMTVFLTPDQRPIYAGTYYPKTAMAHHPSFMDVMTAVSDAWTNNRSGIDQQASNILNAITQAGPEPGPEPTPSDIKSAVAAIERTFDATNGGFGRAPKFPQAPTLEFLLRVAALHPNTGEGSSALRMLVVTLERMARGGIYDHLYGGFARYSVDAQWVVPHFEKMLYDNALLARIYLRTWQLTGDARFRTTAIEVLDYLDTTMADPSGGIHAAEDADSEGEEGKFAVWSWDELDRVLGSDLPVAADIYGFSRDGNFEGRNIPTRVTDLETIAERHDLSTDKVDEVRRRVDVALAEVRSERIAPSRDDKVVSAWNGFAMRAFAEAGAVLEEPRYRKRAEAIAEFLGTVAVRDRRLVRSWRGEPGVGAFADDLAACAVGLYTLFATTGDVRRFVSAEEMVQALRARFGDPEGGFFATGIDAEQLVARPKNIQDNPTPSDNALAMEALQLHAAYTGDLTAVDEMTKTMQAISVVAERHPSFAGHALAIWTTHLAGVKEVAITGSNTAAFERVVWDAFRPDVVVATTSDSETPVPLLKGRVDDTATRAFVCRNLACDLPATDPDQLTRQLATDVAD